MNLVIHLKSKIKVIVGCFAFVVLIFSAMSGYANSNVINPETLTQAKVDKYMKNIADHPRLFFPKGHEAIIKKNISTNASAKFIHDIVISKANKYLTLPPCERVLTGIRLLSVSQEVVHRVIELSYAYRMTGEAKYAKRAEQELLAVAKFSDWNPRHFLDVGEMTFAFAVGYDWLYDYLSAESRNTIYKAILEKGLREGDILAKKKRKFPLRYHINWNAVCNGGLLCGALAVYERDPSYASNIVRRSVVNNTIHLTQYAPNGNYCEGPDYWGYATTYEMRLMVALQTSIGTDFGLMKSQGFVESAKFIKHIIGSSGQSFNYHDSHPTSISFTPAHVWLAKNSDDKGCLNALPNSDESLVKMKTLNLVFALVLCSDVDMFSPQIPTAKVFIGEGQTPVALVRSSWGDNALFMGIKGGSCKAGHAHMDVGTFVFDVGKTRFVSEMTRLSYHILESRGLHIHGTAQDTTRWKLLRYGAKSHSVLIANDSLFDVTASAQIIEKFDTDSERGITLDTTDMYFGVFKKATRKGLLKDNKFVEITDTLETLGKPAKLRWNLITQAKPKIKGNQIILTRDGKKVVVKMHSKYPVKAEIFPFEKVVDVDEPVKNYYAVGFSLELPANTKTTLCTTLTPQ